MGGKADPDEATELKELVALWEQHNEETGSRSYGGKLNLGNCYLDVVLLKNPQHRPGDERPAMRLMVRVPKRVQKGKTGG